MALSEQILATELENLAPAETEAEAIQVLIDAYSVYAADAESNAVPITPAGVALGATAMAPVLVGMSNPGEGVTKIPAAVIAFWVAVAAGLATSFPGATTIVPPPHATLAAQFAALVVQNTIDAATLMEAAESLAEIMHANAIVGGTVTFGVPTFPII